MTYRIVLTCSYPRPIAQIEKEFLLRGLGMLSSDKPIPIVDSESGKAVNWVGKEDLVMQVDSLVVIGQCQCGDPNCHTVQFHHHRSGFSEKIIEMSLEDSRTLSIYIDRERGLISGLEVVRE